MILDHARCITAYSAAYGHIDPVKQQNIERLLSAIEADATVTDVRWAAYMLATVKHECADRWQPVDGYYLISMLTAGVVAWPTHRSPSAGGVSSYRKLIE